MRICFCSSRLEGKKRRRGWVYCRGTIYTLIPRRGEVVWTLRRTRANCSAADPLITRRRSVHSHPRDTTSIFIPFAMPVLGAVRHLLLLFFFFFSFSLSFNSKKTNLSWCIIQNGNVQKSCCGSGTKHEAVPLGHLSHRNRTFHSFGLFKTLMRGGGGVQQGDSIWGHKMIWGFFYPKEMFLTFSPCFSAFAAFPNLAKRVLWL